MARSPPISSRLRHGKSHENDDAQSEHLSETDNRDKESTKDQPSTRQTKKMKHATPRREDQATSPCRERNRPSSTPMSYSHLRKDSAKAIVAPQFISFDSTADLLVHLSTRIIDLMNERNYNSPFLSCISGNIVTPSNRGRGNVVEGFKRMAEILPNYHNEVQNSTCIVDEDEGRAKVVMTMRVSGYVYGTMRQSASLFSWSRSGDRWSCVRYCVVRGIEEFD